MNIRKEELPLALLMYAYFFLVITSFWILKPLKKGLFITFYDQSGFTLLDWHLRASQAELLAKILNMFVAFLAVVVFSILARRFRRQQLTIIFCMFFMACYVLYSFVINQPNGLAVWSFYLFGDLFSTLMVATFFVFLNDSVTPSAAKRLYGLIGLGGVTGGVFGTMVLRVWIDTLSKAEWLSVCFGIATAIGVIAYLAGKRVDGTLAASEPPSQSTSSDIKSKSSAGNPAWQGAKLVFKSRYLLSIVGIVGLYEIVSTIMDFQFTETIAHYLDGADICRQFSTVYTLTNIVSLIVQLFFTSFVMTRFGLKVALLVLPAMIVLGSGAFIVFPILWVGSLLNTADNAFSYSINQSAKETLYVPTTHEEKYNARLSSICLCSDLPKLSPWVSAC